MKRTIIFALLFIPVALFAEWSCDIKLVDSNTISISGSDLAKFKFTDEDNLTVFKNDGTKQVLALENVDKITFSGEVSVTDVNAQANIVFPNPAVDVINVAGAAGLEYIVINYSAAQLQKGTIGADETINVSSLSEGPYILVLSNRTAFRFIKK